MKLWVVVIEVWIFSYLSFVTFFWGAAVGAWSILKKLEYSANYWSPAESTPRNLDLEVGDGGIIENSGSLRQDFHSSVLYLFLKLYHVLILSTWPLFNRQKVRHLIWFIWQKIHHFIRFIYQKNSPFYSTYLRKTANQYSVFPGARIVCVTTTLSSCCVFQL